MIRALKLLAIVLWILGCLVTAGICLWVKKPLWRDGVSVSCFKGLLWIIGIRLTVQGSVSETRPLLLVSNHISYLDVVMLGSVFPFRFTPKKEVARWPVISTACRILGCIFIDRRRERFREGLNDVSRVVAAGEVVSLFPEATTGDGKRLLPFRTGFFQLATNEMSGHTVHVQPAAIIYTHIRKLPIDSSQWPQLAWYGDMDLAPHLWNLLRLGRIDARLEFMPPVMLSQHDHRKRIAAECEQAVAGAIESARA